MLVLLSNKRNKFDYKNTQGNQETVIITLQPILVSV